MAAPIVVELASSEPVDPDLSRALLGACASAAGPGGCVGEGDAWSGEGPSRSPIEPRARVVVSFSAGDASVRVEVLAPIANGAPTWREVSFRNEDPRIERFRAAGLIAAGLVSDLASRETAAVPANPPATAMAPQPRSAVVVRLGGQTGWNGARPWAGAELGADFAALGPVFVALSGSFDRTWARDANGVVAEQAALGLGAGVAAWLAERLEVRVRVGLQLHELRASIQQPVTLEEDSGDRTLTGIETGVDLVLPITGDVGVYAGGRADWWGGKTTVNVQGSAAEVIGAWMASVTLGLNVRLR
jgi:hypothetical protein